VKGARAAQGYVSGGRLAGATTGGTKRNDEPCKRSPLGPRPSRLSSAHSHHSQHSMLHAPCWAGLGWPGAAGNQAKCVPQSFGYHALSALQPVIKLPFHVPATAPLAHQTIFRSASPVSPMRDTLCPPVPPVHRLPKRQRSRRDSEQTRQCILVLARMGAETSGEEEAGRGGEEKESCVTASKDSGCGGTYLQSRVLQPAATL
jgi:hypothetical protein